MASTSSSSAGSGIFDCGNIDGLRKKREEIGDERKFRRMCDSETVDSGVKVLHAVALSGQLETCKFLVEEVGVDIDVKAHRGDTPLLTAMKKRHLHIAKYFIEQGADVTMTDSMGFTALHWSIPLDDMEIKTLLLTNGANIDADSVSGTPLHLAVKTGRAGIVNFLLQNKAEPNSVCKFYGGNSPLVSAIHSKNNTLECVELLLKAKADPNKLSNGLSPLAHAIEAKANNCIESLLAAGADVDTLSSFDLRPIEHAALVNNVEAIWKLILTRPRILATPNWSFARLLSRMNSVQAKERRFFHSQKLWEKGDDAWDKQDYSSAIASYSTGYHMSCDAFIKAYNLAPENEKIGDTPLLTAMKKRHLHIAKYFIEQGADVTVTDSKGCTALHYSISYEDTEIMTLLLSKGADVDADSIRGTPLHCAALSGRAGIVNFLLQNNAEPNSVCKYLVGISPLVSAIYSKTNNTLDCVELLLKFKADPNKLSSGLSPLAHAIEANANSCIDSLLAAGADVDSLSSCDLRLIEHAAMIGNVEAIWKLILARPRIMATPNWSFARLWSRMNSVPAKERKYFHSQKLWEKGDDAWDKQDYSSSITSYTKAIRYDQSRKLYANQSLCWVRKNEGLCALQDAEKCVGKKPDWGKAHLREATAWHLLEGYHMSCKAFMKAYDLTPENEKIER